MNVVKDFLLLMLKIDLNILWSLYDHFAEDKTHNEIILNNLLLILSFQSSEFDSKDLSSLNISNIDFENLNFNKVSFANTKFSQVSFSNSKLINTDFGGASFEYKHGHRQLLSVNGNTIGDFSENGEDFIYVDRFCLRSLNIKTQAEIVFPLKRQAFVSDVRFMNKDKWILILENQHVRIFQIKDLKLIYSGDGADRFFGGVEIMKSYFAIYNDSFSSFERLRILNYDNLNNPFELHHNNNGIFGVCFAPKSGFLVGGGRDGFIFWFSITSKELVKKIPLIKLEESILHKFRSSSKYIYSLSLTSDEKILAVGSTAHCIFLLNFETDQILDIIYLGDSYTTNLKFSPNDLFLAYTDVYRGVIILDAKTHEIIFENKEATNFRFGPDGNTIALFFETNVSKFEIINIIGKVQILKREMTLDFSSVNIGRMKAPIYLIKLWNERGAKNWIQESQLENLKAEQFEDLGVPHNILEKDNVEIIEWIKQYVDNQPC